MSIRSFASSGIAQCPYSIALDYVSEYLSRCGDGAGLTVSLPFRAFGINGRGGFRRRVRLVFHIIEDRDNRSRAHEAINIDWNARTRLLPSFHGVLGFRIAGDGLTELALQCEYIPPFGFLGNVFDRVIGRNLARATAQSLLAQMIAHIEGQESTFRSTFSRPALHSV